MLEPRFEKKNIPWQPLDIVESAPILAIDSCWLKLERSVAVIILPPLIDRVGIKCCSENEYNRPRITPAVEVFLSRK